MGYYDFPCSACGHINNLAHDYCRNPICKTPLPPFAVRRVSLGVERQHLQMKYIAAVDDLHNAAKHYNADAFEKLVIEKGKAVMNLPLADFYEWFLRNKYPLYSYRRMVALGLRERALYENDRKRSLVESNLFGTYDGCIYAALSVNERGLHSYGPVLVVLNDLLVEKRAGMLIENSFTFTNKLKKTKWTDEDDIPPGNLAVWEERHKLALVKHADHLKINDDVSSYSEVILASDGDRRTDHFMEVYVDAAIFPDDAEKILFPKVLFEEITQDAARFEDLIQWQEVKRKINVEEY